MFAGAQSWTCDAKQQQRDVPPASSRARSSAQCCTLDVAIGIIIRELPTLFQHVARGCGNTCAAKQNKWKQQRQPGAAPSSHDVNTHTSR